MRKFRFARSMTLGLAASVLAFAAPASADVTLRTLWEDVPEASIIEKLLPQFTEKTGIKIEVEKAVYSDMHDKLALQLTSPESYYNLLLVDYLWAEEFPSAGWLTDLGPMTKDSGMNLDGFISSLWDIMGRKGDYIPIIPASTYSMGVIYRTDLMGGAAFPDTLEGFVKLISDMKADKDVVGAAMQGQRGDPNSMEFSSYLFAAGGNYLDADGKVVLNGEASKRALSLYVEAIQKAAQEGALNANLDDTGRLMCSGKAFSMISYWLMLAPLSDATDCPAVAGKLALAVMPGGRGNGGGWGWGIASNVSDEEKAAAWEFIKWVQSPEVAKQRALLGHAPVQSEVFRDPDVLAKFPYYAEAEKVVESGVSFPIFTYTSEFEDVLGTQISLAASGQTTIDEALSAANKGLNDLLAR